MYQDTSQSRMHNGDTQGKGNASIEDIVNKELTKKYSFTSSQESETHLSQATKANG